jgi:hypothetical protein
VDGADGSKGLELEEGPASRCQPPPRSVCLLLLLLLLSAAVQSTDARYRKSPVLVKRKDSVGQEAAVSNLMVQGGKVSPLIQKLTTLILSADLVITAHSLYICTQHCTCNYTGYVDRMNPAVHRGISGERNIYGYLPANSSRVL